MSRPKLPPVVGTTPSSMDTAFFEGSSETNHGDRPIRLNEAKLRTFACACCRLIWDQLPPPVRNAVEAAEAYSAGAIGPSTLKQAHDLCEHCERMPEAMPVPESIVDRLLGRTSAVRYYRSTECIHRLANATITLADVMAILDDLLPWRGDSIENDAVRADHLRIFRRTFELDPEVVGLD